MMDGYAWSEELLQQDHGDDGRKAQNARKAKKSKSTRLQHEDPCLKFHYSRVLRYCIVCADKRGCGICTQVSKFPALPSPPLPSSVVPPCYDKCVASALQGGGLVNDDERGWVEGCMRASILA